MITECPECGGTKWTEWVHNDGSWYVPLPEEWMCDTIFDEAIDENCFGYSWLLCICYSCHLVVS